MLIKYFLVIMLSLLFCTPAFSQENKSSASSVAPELDEGTMAGSTPISLVETAYLSHRRGDYKQAIADYTAIIQRRGLTRRERAVSYLLRGEAKKDDGQLNEAIEDFNIALKQWPNYPQAHFFRGRVYEMQNKLTEAYIDMARASYIDPENDIYKSKLSILKHRMKDNSIDIPKEEDPNDPWAMETLNPEEASSLMNQSR